MLQVSCSTVHTVHIKEFYKDHITNDDDLMQAGLYTLISVCIGYCHFNFIFSLQIVIVLRQVENLEEHSFINL
jgi:hypothetical protein